MTDLAGACVEVPDLLPRGMVPSEAKLVAAAGDLDDLVTGANDVDVTFALQPMTEALYARATAANGQPAVEAERQYLEALKELDRACRNVGEPIIRR